jgi:1,4-dihydroxy-2-naphthoyl-CoA synthase
MKQMGLKMASEIWRLVREWKRVCLMGMGLVLGNPLVLKMEIATWTERLKF